MDTLIYTQFLANQKHYSETCLILILVPVDYFECYSTPLDESTYLIY